MRQIFNTILAALISFLLFTPFESKAQYCAPPINFIDNSWDYIDSVSFGSVQNKSGQGATAYSDFTALGPIEVSIGVQSTITVRIMSDADEYVHVFIDWNQNDTLDDPGEMYTLASGTAQTGLVTLTYDITPPATALPGNTRMRVVVDWDDMNMGDPCFGPSLSSIFGTYGEIEDYTVTVLAPVPTSVVITTAGSAPAEITTNGGTLQLEAEVLPASANQDVIWTIVPGTGNADISSTGLVTALSNGNVWAKAVAVGDTTIMDSLEIQISGQIVPITGVVVGTQNGVPAIIDVNGGTLQLEAQVLPAEAVQDVLWSLTAVTGMATISNNGLVTAIANGTVWAKAVSLDDPSFADSILITITNQGTGLKGLFAENAVDVYPVPFENELVVDLKNVAYQGMQYRLVNALGQVMRQAMVHSRQMRIETGNLAAGMYTLILLDAEGRVSALPLIRK